MTPSHTLVQELQLRTSVSAVRQLQLQVLRGGHLRVSFVPTSHGDDRHGDAVGSGGGTPLHQVQAQLGYFNNGLGARLGANWQSATDVTETTGDNLHFSPVGTFDLRFFANPGDIPEVVVKHPWLRGTQLRFEINNVFDAKPRVHDAAGNVPLNYQADLLNPLGRTIMISFRSGPSEQVTI